jgi:Protein of unknown function (DUF4058)
LNRSLPRERYQALANVHLGKLAVADIAEFEHEGEWSPRLDADGGVATLAVPESIVSIEANFPDEFAVEIGDHRDGMRLVGVIEFVSPANKDREEQRRQIAAKCSSYLKEGIGVVLVDVVTNRHANLHNELMDLLQVGMRMPDVPTYVVGYRPQPDEERNRIDLWPYVVRVGSRIPAVPLVLKGGPTIMMDLESTYAEAAADHGL